MSKRVDAPTRIETLRLLENLGAAGQAETEDVPDAAGQRAFIEGSGETTEGLEDFWFTYLVRVLSEDLGKTKRGQLAEFLDVPAADIDNCLSKFRNLRPKPLLALDELDQRLK